MKVLAIPDLHCPFQHKRAFDFVSKVAKDFKPNKVICLGDEIDAHGWSRYGREPDAPGQQDELQAAKEALQPFFQEFPNVTVCHSNHTQRAAKRATAAGIPSQLLKEIRQALGAPPGWTWQFSTTIDKVLYLHGDGYTGKNAAINCAERNRQSCVIGHVHSHASIHYLAGHKDKIFGMCCGCLIDTQAIAFKYAEAMPYRPVLALGLIENGVPRLVPLEV